MAIKTDYHNNKHHLRHHVIPDSNEGLDIGLAGQRFHTGRFKALVADTVDAITLTFTTVVTAVINTLTVSTALTLSFLTGPGYLKIDSSEAVAVQAVPIPVADGGTGAITAALARTALGSTTVGDAVFVAATSAAARTAIDSPSNAEAILDTIVDAKGDLISASAADTPLRLAVGANDLPLVADSTTGTGLAYKALPVAGGGTGSATAADARTALGVPSSAEAILDTLIDAKGDLIAGTAADTPAALTVGANRTILEADSTAGTGLAWVARALGMKSMQVFAGNGTWTRPTGIRRVLVMVLGGGGGGGGILGAGATHATSSGGGGGGGTGIVMLDVSALGTSTITVGGGGAGGVAGANAGTVGTNSTWADGTNTVTGNGGAGGQAGNTNVTAPGGAGGGGTATGGYVVVGDAGAGGHYNSGGVTSAAGSGGGSHLGGGAQSAGANVTGQAGVANTGGGGSGAVSHGDSTDRAGGAGGSGRIIVYEYE